VTPRTFTARPISPDRKHANALHVIFDEVRRLQRLQIHNITFNAVQLMQPDFRGRAANARGEAILRQALLQWHLTTLEACFDGTPGSSLQTLVATAGGFTHTRADTSSNALRIALRAGRRL
jgi:hypothetical protein